MDDGYIPLFKKLQPEKFSGCSFFSYISIIYLYFFCQKRHKKDITYIRKLCLHKINFSVRHRGLEPRTTWLKVKCSTTWASIPYIVKCPEPESNQRHEDFQSSALPTELSGHWIAGTGFEPATFGLWARRASGLLHPATSYKIMDYIQVGEGGFEPPKA